MGEYVRPVIVEQVFRLDDGTVIPYGRHEGPLPGADPEHPHRLRHQERYAPIDTVAEALIDFVAEEYAVTVVEGADPAAVFWASRVGGPHAPVFRRVVAIRPASPVQPSITLAFGEEPGLLEVVAGRFSEFDVWHCGCDGCDEPWQESADSLESLVLGVVAGRLVERMPGWPRRRGRYELDGASGSIPADLLPRHRRRAIRTALAALPGGRWQPYTRRDRDLATAVDPLGVAKALHVRHEVSAPTAIEAATAALVEGHDGPALRELAGAHPETNPFELGDLIDRALLEVGVAATDLDDDTAAVLVARHHCRAVREGRMPMRELAAWAHTMVGHGGADAVQPLVDLDDALDEDRGWRVDPDRDPDAVVELFLAETRDTASRWRGPVA